MRRVWICGVYKETEHDELSKKEAQKILKPCPVCGSKAYIEKDIVDGYYFGWSVGCPRYYLNDGIHGHNLDTPESERFSIFYLSSAEECVKKWNERVERYERIHTT